MHTTLCVVLLLLCSSPNDARRISAPVKFPNIGYLGLGYDIMYGNPHAWGKVDPGFRNEVFDLSVYTGQTTPDGRYLVPNGTQVMVETACSLSYTDATAVFTGVHSYQTTLKTAASVQTGWGPFSAAFSANDDFQNLYSATTTSSSSFISSHASCSVYKAALSMPSCPPALSENFAATIAAAPLIFNPDDPDDFYYSKILNFFGTHISQVVHMGGSFGRISQFTGLQWSNLQSQLSTEDVTATAASSFDAMKASGAVLNQQQQQIAQIYSSQATKQSEFSVGSRPPSNGSINSWVTSSQIDPMPLWYQLIPISTLLTPQFFPGDKYILSKQRILITALTYYCPLLMNASEVGSCDAPPQDKNNTFVTSINFWLSTERSYNCTGGTNSQGLVSSFVTSPFSSTLTISGQSIPSQASFFALYPNDDDSDYDEFSLYFDITTFPTVDVSVLGLNVGRQQINCSSGALIVNATSTTLTCSGGRWTDGNTLTIKISISQ